MASIKNVSNGDIRRALLNLCLSPGTLAINAASAATVKTTTAINYLVDGVLKSKASLTAQAITPTHDYQGNPVATGVAAYVQPVLTTVIYLLCLDASGTVAVVQGSYAGQSLVFPGDISKILTGDGGVPKEPFGFTCVGAVKVALANAATFTPGTTALDATDVTATYFNIGILPATL